MNISGHPMWNPFGKLHVGWWPWCWHWKPEVGRWYDANGARVGNEWGFSWLALHVWWMKLD
jgi:hypothetical protein